jgi:Ca-activated chloride channel family protein
VVVPPSQEHDVVARAITSLRMDNGTAIGDAVASSLQAVAAVAGSEDDPPPAHVVLLSDGANTAGRPVAEAVEQAQLAGVPVSTIAYGTQAGEVHIDGERIRVPVDAQALAELAADTSGTAYEASSGDELEDVYADIGSAIGTTTESREVGAAVAGLALVAVVGAAAASFVWSPRSA